MSDDAEAKAKRLKAELGRRMPEHTFKAVLGRARELPDWGDRAKLLERILTEWKRGGG